MVAFLLVGCVISAGADKLVYKVIGIELQACTLCKRAVIENVS
jgi:hypothetical protein